MKLRFNKVSKGVGQTQYNQLVYTLEKQHIYFKREAKVKRGGNDNYFIIVGNLRFKFNCIGELTEIITRSKHDC